MNDPIVRNLQTATLEDLCQELGRRCPNVVIAGPAPEEITNGRTFSPFMRQHGDKFQSMGLLTICMSHLSKLTEFRG